MAHRKSIRKSPEELESARQHLELLISKMLNERVSTEITSEALYAAYGKNYRRKEDGKRIQTNLGKREILIEGIPNPANKYDKVKLSPKPLADTMVEKMPIVMVGSMLCDKPSLGKVYIDDTLEKAISIMQSLGYSQLAVVKNETLKGFISWQTIAEAMRNGESSQYVRYYMSTQCPTVSVESPILDAIKALYDCEFVVVLANTKEPLNVITGSDVAMQFRGRTQAFLLLNEIEFQIRRLLKKKLLLETIQKLETNSLKIESLDDLSMGEYYFLLVNDDNWKRVGMRTDKSVFLSMMSKVVEIRNKAMHFRPEGLCGEEIITLQCFRNYLSKILNADNCKHDECETD